MKIDTFFTDGLASAPERARRAGDSPTPPRTSPPGAYENRRC